MAKDKIPTAEDFLQEHHQISHYYDDKTDRMVCFDDDVKKAMIEFAKIHVKAALEEASTNVKVITDYDGVYQDVNRNSILSAYPLNNIK